MEQTQIHQYIESEISRGQAKDQILRNLHEKVSNLYSANELARFVYATPEDSAKSENKWLRAVLITAISLYIFGQFGMIAIVALIDWNAVVSMLTGTDAIISNAILGLKLLLAIYCLVGAVRCDRERLNLIFGFSLLGISVWFLGLTRMLEPSFGQFVDHIFFGFLYFVGALTSYLLQKRLFPQLNLKGKLRKSLS